MTKTRLAWLFSLAFCIGNFAISYQAANAQSNFTGLGDGTTWNQAANWDAGVPDGVNANVGDQFTVTLGTDQTINELDLVGDGSIGVAQLDHNSGVLNASGWIKVGVNSGNDGTYNMSGNAVTNMGALFLGHFGGSATLNMSGDAMLTGGGLNFGIDASADVSVNISGNASIDVTDINLGNAMLVQTAGQVTASSWIAIGNEGTAIYDISGGSLTQLAEAKNWLTIGESQPSSMLVSGTASVDADSLGMIVGRFDGGDGLLEITGSNASISVNDLRVGVDDMGTDTLAQGTLSWIADADGISPIVSADNTEFGFMDSTLIVDLTADADFDSFGDKGTPIEIVLIQNEMSVNGTFVGLAEDSSVDIGGGKTATISYSGGDGNDIVLELLTDAGLIGDINCDGAVNLLDVNPFIDILQSGEFSIKADINQDGAVNLIDVQPFVELLSGG